MTQKEKTRRRKERQVRAWAAFKRSRDGIEFTLTNVGRRVTFDMMSRSSKHRIVEKFG